MTQSNLLVNPLLSGPFAPLGIELDVPSLQITGELPPSLNAVLYRIGPNPQFPPLEPYSPLQGDGMIHAFRIANGHVSYRNRWVRTRRWLLENAAGRALFSTLDPRGHDPSVAGLATDGAANTHILAHVGRLLALEEGNKPIEIDADTLETIGPFDFGGRLTSNMTAHPRIDPVSGEMIFFSNFPDHSFDGSLLLHVADAEGARHVDHGGLGRAVAAQHVLGRLQYLVRAQRAFTHAGPLRPRSLSSRVIWWLS